MRTGILGGTFDPIHIAHLHTAESSLRQFSLDRVIIMPAGDPWQKTDREITEAGHRVTMCRLAVADVDGLEVDTREVEREGPTYTIDSLLSFDAEEELFVIVGSDAAAGIRTWHRSSEVIERASIIVAPRPGAKTHDIQGAFALQMGLLEISGTDIRERVRRRSAYRYLVTGPVYRYIESNGLYADRQRADKVAPQESLESSS